MVSRQKVRRPRLSSKELMRTCLVLACTVIPSLAWSTDAPAFFAARERLARKIEEQPETQKYLYEGMFPVIGSSTADAMKICLTSATASTDKFTLVADVLPDGRFGAVAVQPTTNTARCFAAAFRRFRAPPPPTCDCGPLPIAIDMAIKP